MCFFSPSDQMIAAMPIVLNLDSRGLSGFIIALYLIMDVFLITRKGENAVTIQKRKNTLKILMRQLKMQEPINRDGDEGEDTDADREDGYVAAKFAEDQT